MRQRIQPFFVLSSLVLSACGSDEASPGAGDAAGSAAPCADIYDPNRVPVFELEIAPEELALMERDCEQEAKVYRPAKFKYGSERADVMVRLRGHWSWRCEKKQFVIAFNEADPAGRFHGLRKLALDAPWYEPSLLVERLAFSFMRRLGAPWSCANNARLTVNGDYYGVYANLERIDREYLERHFPGDEADGNLYDGGVELRTNESVADVSRRDALMAASDLASIDELADLDQAVRVWAGLAMLPDRDSYWAGVEINYFLYDHPSRGFLWLPYDMDLSMQQGRVDAETSSVEIGVLDAVVRTNPLTYQHPQWRRERLLERVLSDAHWCNRFLEELRRATEAYDVAHMTHELKTWSAQIAEAVLQDPHKPFSDDDHQAALATLEAFMPRRRAFVEGWLDNATCPVTSWPE